MMAAPLAGSAIVVHSGRRKHPLPRPLPARVGILQPQGPRELRPPRPLRQAPFVLLPHRRPLVPYRPRESLLQHPAPVPVALPSPHRDPLRPAVDTLPRPARSAAAPPPPRAPPPPPAETRAARCASRAPPPPAPCPG